jgi:flavin-dependent dehydrogenase
MNPLDELPAVLGSSLSGLLVSLSLSRAGIEHVVVGGEEPLEVPRLGESLNECAGPELWRLFGREFGEFFYTKSHISLFNGHIATIVHLANPQRSISRLQRFTNGRGESRRVSWSQTLFHVDRIGLDRAVYHKVRDQPTCHFVECRVKQLDYDHDRDTVLRIALQDNTSIRRPRYVFDASGPRGLVAERAGVKNHSTSRAQRVVWTHYLRIGTESPHRHWWECGTNLLRLFRDADGMEGIAWLIPLGHSLSLGISLDAEKYDAMALDNQQIMGQLDDAFARRGIKYREEFREPRPVQSLTHRYSVRDRAYGGNWLLVGGTFIQIWFPSSAGLWTTIAAAGMAPQLIEQPLQRGAQYEAIMRKLSPFHTILDDMIHGPSFTSEQEAYRFWANWLAAIPSRLTDYLRIRRGHLDSKRPSYWLYERATRLFRRFPRLQLLCWGFVVARIKKSPRLADQATEFPNYRRVIYFRTLNYMKGLGHVLRWCLPARSSTSAHRRAVTSDTSVPSREESS